MKKIVLLLVAVCIFCGIVKAAEVTFPALSGQVVDEAGVLTPQTKAELTALLQQDKNNQVVVAVVKNLRGHEGREYGIELARHWQLGQKGKDNGVLILISPEDRYAGIEVGYGLEGVITDSVSGRILREQIIPPLKQNLDYNQAVLNGAAAVMYILSGGQLKDTPEDSLTMDDILSTLFTLLMIYLILSGKGPRGGGMFIGGARGRGIGLGFFGGGGSFGGGGASRRF